MQTVDMIIKSQWILTVNKQNDCLKDHAIIVNKGKIIALIPNTQQQYQTNTLVDCGQHTLIPGLINSHSHAGMSLFKGIADDQPLNSWLYDYILPAENQWINEEFINNSLEIALAEMIKSGTTCFNDMYYFPNLTAKMALKHGIRAAIGLIMVDFPTIWAQNSEEYLQKGIKLYDKYNSSSLIKPVFAPHSPYAVSDDSLKQILKYSEQLDVNIHMHIHETQHEINESIKEHGARPLARLDALGLLSPKMIAVHMTHLNEQEISRIQETNTSIVHCPKSNLKLASGIADINELHKAQINTALGTDGSASNNNLDLLSEMQYAGLLAKGHSMDAQSIKAQTLLRMATINGAKALGWEDNIGSLEVGKQADIVAINTQDISCQPYYEPTSQLIYSSAKSQISDVWVAGKPLLKNHQLVTMHEEELINKAQFWAGQIKAN